jgi:hypothetical protein
MPSPKRGRGGRRGKGPQVLIAYANCFHSSRPATSSSEPQNAGQDVLGFFFPALLASLPSG